MNLVVLVGRLGQDPDIRYIQSTGNYVTRFSIAVDREFKSKDGQNITDWFNVSVWGKQAESCANYLAKGRLVAVRGRIYNNNYTDKNGTKHYAQEINADQVQFLEWGDDRNKNAGGGGFNRFSQDEQDQGVFRDEESQSSSGLDEAGYRALSDDEVPF